MVSSATLALLFAHVARSHAEPEASCSGSLSWRAGEQDEKEGAEETSLLQRMASQSNMRADDLMRGGSGIPQLKKVVDDFGPLQKLIGTWVSKQKQGGRAQVNVPITGPRSEYDDSNNFNAFECPITYTERLVIKPITETVLNRGYIDAAQINPTGNLDQVIVGLSYHTEIHNDVGDKRDECSVFTGLIHVEDGQWLWNQVPGISTAWTVARQALIPHGNSLIATGSVSEMSGVAVNQTFEEMLYTHTSGANPWSKVPTNAQPFVQARYGECFRPEHCEPLWFLQQAMGNFTGDVVESLEVRTANAGGGLLQLPNPEAQVNISEFNSTFYLSTETSSTGASVPQLSYIQNARFRFNSNQGGGCMSEQPPLACRIEWNHVQTNTLIPESHAPMPSPTPAPTTIAPTPSPQPQCAKLWGQCGGDDFSSLPCCDQDDVCVSPNPDYPAYKHCSSNGQARGILQGTKRDGAMATGRKQKSHT